MGTFDRSDESQGENLGTHDHLFAGEERTTVPTGRSGRIFRRLTHNAWRILFLWLVISSALTYGIYRYFEPSYQASSMIKIESYQPELFEHSLVAHDGTQPSYLQTEIESIRSNPVLTLALSNSEFKIADYPMIKESLDPKTELKEKLELEILPNTQWIRVAVDSKDPKEAADIVNAVVTAYHESTEDTGLNITNMHMKKNLTKILREDLTKYKQGLEIKIAAMRKSLLELAAKGDALAAKAVPEVKLDPAVVKAQGVKTWNPYVDKVQATFLRDDLERYYRMFDQVDRKLEQLEFARDKAGINIEEIIPAEVPKVPMGNQRLKYSVIAPVFVLLSLLGVFLVFGHDHQ